MSTKFIDALSELEISDIGIDEDGRIIILNKELQAKLKRIDTDDDDDDDQELLGTNFYKCNDKCKKR